MANTATKDKDKEPSQTLPVGHPQAGYVAPDLSYHDGTGDIPEEEKTWHEARNDARDEQADEVGKNEDDVARTEIEERDKRQEEEQKKAEDDKKDTAKSGGTTVSSSTSKSS
jgi:hypothetical protein